MTTPYAREMAQVRLEMELARIRSFAPPEEPEDKCPHCGYTDWEPTDYVYGDDADGHRGVRIKGRWCGECDHEETLEARDA